MAHLGEHAVHRRPQPRVAQPSRQRALEIDGRERQRLGELRRARDQPTLVVEHDRVPVEDQLVLASDEVAERHGAEVVARPLGEHPLARLALPAQYGDALGFTISDAPASASSEAGAPGTQMSSQIVSPIRASPRSSTAPPSPAWK